MKKILISLLSIIVVGGPTGIILNALGSSTSGFAVAASVLVLIFCIIGYVVLNVTLESTFVNHTIKQGDVVYVKTGHNDGTTYWLVKDVHNNKVTIVSHLGTVITANDVDLKKIKNG